MSNNIVTCEISFLEELKMVPPVPYEVQIRNKLNSHGFKFEDDGKPSLITNLQPKPLGTFSWYRDDVAGKTYYKQEIMNVSNS